jgi:hypothetical protein
MAIEKQKPEVCLIICQSFKEMGETGPALGAFLWPTSPNRVPAPSFKRDGMVTCHKCASRTAPERHAEMTVYDLEPEDFDKLFCKRCKGEGKCSKSPTAMRICQFNVDVGIWDRDCRKQGV